MDRTEELMQEFFLDAGLISKAELKVAINDAKERKISLGEALVMTGSLGEDDVRRAMSSITGIPFVDLKNKALSYETLSLIPEPISRIKKIIAFNRGNHSVEVASLEPLDTDTKLFLEEKIKEQILFRLTDSGSIKYALIAYQRGVRAHAGTHIDIHSESLLRELSKSKSLSGEYIKVLADSSQAHELIESLMWYAVSQHSDHIHFEPTENGLSVKFRINGELHEGMSLPKRIAPIVSARIKMMANLSLVETSIIQEGKMSFGEGSGAVSTRVSVIPTKLGERVVVRLLKESSAGFTLEALGFHGKSLEDVYKTLHSRSGLVLVIGGPSSGKTTLLYTMLDIANRPGKNTISIEETIEYSMSGVNQIVVRPDRGITFASGIRASMRQDVDILLISDIKDKETALLAVSLASHGKLVFAGIKSKNLEEALMLIEELGVSSQKLSSVITASITCNLISRSYAKDSLVDISHKEITKYIKDIDIDLVRKSLLEEGVISPIDDSKVFSVVSNRGSDDIQSREKKGVYEVLPFGMSTKALLSVKDLKAIKEEMRIEKSLSFKEELLFKAVSKEIPIEEFTHFAKKS